jgi:hypothetical protein
VALPVAAFAASGAAAAALVRRVAPEASGSGIPHLKAVLHHLRGMLWQRILPVKFLGGAAGIGAGLALGREGPTVQMGGAVGQMVSRWFGSTPRERQTLIAAGAGAGLALLADYRIGGPSTAFLMAFANVGLAADSGASWTLPRLVGYAKATELLLLAEPVRAAEAERIGLLTRVVESDDEIVPAAQQLAARLAAGPTVAYGQIKRELLVASSGGLAEALATEADAQNITGGTTDHQHATRAFVAKEKPTFTGA